MSSWVLGTCGSNVGAPGFFQCQPSDPFAGLDLEGLPPAVYVPRIKYVVHPSNRSLRKRLDEENRQSSRSGDGSPLAQHYSIQVGGSSPESPGLLEPNGEYTPDNNGVFAPRTDRYGNLLPPPMTPVSETQVSARSSDRIRSLQALLGGSALTDRHGRPPPLSAPYYQSGALHEADEDLEPQAISTPEMMRESAWVH
eukprot:Protomagalhaensia_wolfi_Nauph_80__1953@NODE_2232_length_1159_cov_173_875893_g1742_i0_p1_GENE_NODE_2232_length_1159_cov_173_875893_g1742_i0NODE_2232_length_1159_cov_173_875893_g1742_i0_p1_ORF_typecomplete_len197_score9_73_NODE_2232_length_1159_cov_173_875893_g1742_i05251115